MQHRRVGHPKTLAKKRWRVGRIGTARAAYGCGVRCLRELRVERLPGFTGACVAARYGSMPLTSPMAVSETLARTMIQNASRSMADDFCEDKQRHGHTVPRSSARSITVLANRIG